MYYKYFYTGHNVETTFVHPLPSPMADFSIAAYGENLWAEQSVLIDTMLKVHIIIMAKFSIKWLQRQTLSSHYENVYAWSRMIKSKTKHIAHWSRYIYIAMPTKVELT